MYVGEGGYRAWITNSIHPGQVSSCGFVTPWNHHWLYGVHHLNGPWIIIQLHQSPLKFVLGCDPLLLSDLVARGNDCHASPREAKAIELVCS